MPRKPTSAAIRGADPLPSRVVSDPLACCNVCALASGELGAWRAHDDRDQPLPGPAALMFIGKDHRVCMRTMERHPRLYAEETGAPGHMPLLCGPCRNREGMSCRHPDLKANGGAGLLIKLDGGLPRGVIVCPPPRIVRHARECAGREVRL